MDYSPQRELFFLDWHQISGNKTASCEAKDLKILKTNTMTAKGLLGTILLGVAAGVAIGILVAPEKGKLNKKVSDKTHDLEEKLKGKLKSQTEKFDDLADILETGIEDFKGKVDKLSEKLQNKLA